MNQFKTDARTGLQYELQGDYYVIAGEEDEKLLVGIWVQRHLRWLKQNRRVTIFSPPANCAITCEKLMFKPSGSLN